MASFLILLKAFDHHVGKRYVSISIVFGFADVNNLAIEIQVRPPKIADFLASKPCGIDETEHEPML